MKIAIAIPCYNCEAQIGRLLLELDTVLIEQELISEVFLIENKGNDSTLAEAIRTIPTLKTKNRFSVFQNPKNIGLGGTHKVAFTLAKKKDLSHLLILHGDHQATPRDIPLLIENLQKLEGITVLGSRFLNKMNLSGYSRIRTAGNIALNLFYSIATKTRVSDLGSGLNVFRLADLNPDSYQNFDDGFTFNMDLLLYLIDKKIKFQYLPIRWTTTDQISNARALSVGLKTLIKLFRWCFSLKNKNPNHYDTKNIAIG